MTEPLTDAQETRLDRAWEAFEEGDLDAAVREVEAIEGAAQEHPEVRMLIAGILLDTGDPEGARVELERARGQVEDEALFEFLGAEIHLEQGNVDAAEAGYRRAHELNPDIFTLPMRMPREEFERVVAEAMGHLPSNLRVHFDELPVVVKPVPGEEAQSLSPSLLGLFVGRSRGEESVFDVPDVPPAIYIYQRNLELSCGSRETLVEEIARTLYHELGHYLGLEEDELRDRDID